MNNGLSSSEINQWFERPENRRWLSRAARTINKEIELGRIPPVFKERNSRTEEPPEDQMRIIESELVAVLIEKQELLEKLIRSDDRQSSRFISTVFKNHCLDIARSKTWDLRRYLYKRLSDALRNSDQFQTRVPKERHQFVTFSCSAESRAIPSLTEEDLTRISFPFDRVKGLEYDDINRNAVLLDLSEYFWHEVRRMFGGKAVWVEVWSVIEWIGRQVSYKESDATVGVEKSEAPFNPADSKDPDQQHDPAEGIPDHSYRPDAIHFDRQAVKKWAAGFAEQLSRKEKAVCHYGWDCGMGLEEIADKLGYKSASGPHYILNQAKSRLRRFLCDLEWLNPDDLDEEAFSLFHDTLTSILKKSVSAS